MPRWPDWTGFSRASWEKDEDHEVRPAKTLWDWMDLIAVPLVLAVIALAFNSWESGRQTRREEAATKRARQIAQEARWDAVLQTYIKQVTNLILHEQLVKSSEDSPVRTVARTLTLAAIRRLDGGRKGEVIRYLVDTSLITGRADRDDESKPPRFAQLPPRISLDGADLRDADLRGAELVGVTFAGADMRGARFDGAQLDAIDFDRVRLQNASFSGSELGSVDFNRARLDGASFNGARLAAGYGPVKLGSKRPAPVFYNRFDFACISDATFRDATLDGLSLKWAIGTRVDLRNSKFDAAVFKGAQIREVQVTRNLVHGTLPAEWPATTDKHTLDFRLPYFCSPDGLPAD